MIIARSSNVISVWLFDRTQLEKKTLIEIKITSKIVFISPERAAVNSQTLLFSNAKTDLQRCQIDNHFKRYRHRTFRGGAPVSEHSELDWGSAPGARHLVVSVVRHRFIQLWYGRGSGWFVILYRPLEKRSELRHKINHSVMNKSVKSGWPPHENVRFWRQINDKPTTHSFAGISRKFALWSTIVWIEVNRIIDLWSTNKISLKNRFKKKSNTI